MFQVQSLKMLNTFLCLQILGLQAKFFEALWSNAPSKKAIDQSEILDLLSHDSLLYYNMPFGAKFCFFKNHSTLTLRGWGWEKDANFVCWSLKPNKFRLTFVASRSPPTHTLSLKLFLYCIYWIYLSIYLSLFLSSYCMHIYIFSCHKLSSSMSLLIAGALDKTIYVIGGKCWLV